MKCSDDSELEVIGRIKKFLISAKREKRTSISEK